MVLIVEIKKAIAELKERTGSSRVAIKKVLEKAAGKEMSGVTNRAFLTALKKGVTDGVLVQVKGSYKLSAAAKKAPPNKKMKIMSSPTKLKSQSPLKNNNASKNLRNSPSKNLKRSPPRKDIGIVQPENHINDLKVLQKAVKGASYQTRYNVLSSQTCCRIIEKIFDTQRKNVLVDQEEKGENKFQWSLKEFEQCLTDNEWMEVQHLVKQFNISVNKVMLRYWKADGKCIPMHLDHHAKVMQFALNHNFEGGELYYWSEDDKPVRQEGMCFFHDNTVPHGVTKLINGQRYSVYFLQN